MTSRTDPVKCSEVGCDNTFAPHSWGAIQAHDNGWFQQKNGNNWCPEHLPAWVVNWRIQQKERNLVCICGHKLYEHDEKGFECEKHGCTCPKFRTS